MVNLEKPEEVTNFEEKITQLEEDLKLAKECTISKSDVKRSIEDFTLETLEQYCKDNEDTPDRVIARASEILINRHPYELNLIITQLCNSLSGNYSEEEENELSKEFTAKWIENGLGFD